MVRIVVSDAERRETVLLVLRNGLVSLGEGMWGRLNHITDAHDARVDLEGADVLQEEAMEARRHQVESAGILFGCLKVGDELKAFGVVREHSGWAKELFNHVHWTVNGFLSSLDSDRNARNSPLLIRLRIELGDGRFSERCKVNVAAERTRTQSDPLR